MKEVEKMCPTGQTLWGLPMYETKLLPECCFILIASAESDKTRFGPEHNLVRVCTTGEHTNVKTIQLDVNVSVPVNVATDMLASRALEVLKRELTRAAKKAVDDFVTHGVTAQLENIAVKASSSTTKVSKD